MSLIGFKNKFCIIYTHSYRSNTIYRYNPNYAITRKIANIHLSILSVALILEKVVNLDETLNKKSQKNILKNINPKQPK